MEVKTGKYKTLGLGPTVTVQEHIHIPSKQPGHEGYLAFVCDMHDQQLSEVAIVEAEHIEKGPIARIKVPFRLRVQVHGNWVPAEELQASVTERNVRSVALTLSRFCSWQLSSSSHF